MTALLSKWLEIKFSLTTTETGFFFLGAGVAALISNTLFSWIADKIGKRIIILVGTGLTGIWIGIFPFISSTVPIAIVSIIILNFFGAISMGSYNTHVTEVAPINKGTAVSINNTFGQLSQAGAVLLFGKIIFESGLPAIVQLIQRTVTCDRIAYGHGPISANTPAKLYTVHARKV